ncbi:MAG: peptide chain release factor 2 [Oscillospiraceae bacterium]
MLEFEEYKVKLNNLKPELTALGEALKLSKVRSELSELTAETQLDGFWDDLERSQTVLKRTKQLKGKLEIFEGLENSFDDLVTICEMALEENDESMLEELTQGFSALTNKIDEIRLTTFLAGEHDSAGAIMSFHAGAGGTEAQDWAEMLYRMYMRWSERHGFTFKVLDYLDGEEAGLKSATISIDGENAYGFLKSENGIHRLVRISPFDSSGRRHTSFAAVEVMPQITDETEMEIRPEDLKVDTYRSSGAGGQHVNKTESAIRITHIPSGVVVSCQNERSQHQNREYAMSMLRSRLAEIKERQHLEKIEDIKGVQMKIEWGSQIRSYVFMPYTLAKDHRTNFENGNINAVMDGDIDGFINAYLAMNAGK